MSREVGSRGGFGLLLCFDLRVIIRVLFSYYFVGGCVENCNVVKSVNRSPIGGCSESVVVQLSRMPIGSGLRADVRGRMAGSHHKATSRDVECRLRE